MVIKSRLKNNVTVVFFMICIAVGSSILTQSFSVFFFHLLLIFITIPFWLNSSTEITKVYLLVFLVSIIFLFALDSAYSMYYGAPYYNGGSDDLFFESKGIILSLENIFFPQRAIDSGILGITTGSSFYVVFISFIYSISETLDGYNTIIPKLFNIYFFIWLIMLMNYFLRKYSNFTTKSCTYFTLAIGLFPNMIYVNSHIFRDTLNVFQILLILYIIDKLLDFNFKSLVWFFFLIPLMYITYYTRSMSIMIAIGLTLILILERTGIKKKWILFALVPLVFSTNLLETLGISRYIEYYSIYNASVADQGFTQLIFMYPILPIGIVLRSALALIVPIPNFFLLFKETSKILYDILTFIIYIGVIIQIVFVPFIFKRLLKFDWLVLSFFVVFVSVIGSTFTFRHLILYYPFMAAIAIEGFISTRSEQRKIMLVISLFISFLLSVIYIMLKFF